MPNDLNDYFHFDAADLAANRQGQLSEPQQTRLVQENRAARTQAWGCGLLVGVFIIVPPLWGWWAWGTMEPWGKLLLLVWFMGGLPLALVYMAMALMNLVRALRSGFARPDYTVQTARGPVNIVGVQHQRRQGHTIKYELHVGGQRFDVDAEAGRYLMQGEPYAVYYVKTTIGAATVLIPTDRILSVEKLVER